MTIERPEPSPPAQWEFYPCDMEGSVAWIAVDLAVRETIDATVSPTLVSLRIELAEHRDGVTTAAEFEVQERIVAAVETFVLPRRGRYVGHYTVDGVRYAFAYGDVDEPTVSRLASELAAEHARTIGFFVENEPAHDAYFRNLVPSEDDWQVINDLRVLDQLREHGDALTAPRRVDHLAYFTTEGAADAFAAWVGDEGFAVDEVVPASDAGDRSGLFCVRFCVDQVPTLGDLRSVELRRACAERGGEYDGWGCTVIVPE